MANTKTVREIEALKPKKSAYQVTASPGLSVRVATNGVKKWVVRYTVAGKQRDARLTAPYGSKPADGVLTLAEARTETARIRALARRGIDFQVQDAELRKQATLVLAAEAEQRYCIQDLYNKWITTVTRQNNNAALIALFARHILPTIGSIELRKLTEGDILAMLRKLRAAGTIRTMQMVHDSLLQMLHWAEERAPWRRLLVEGNPADLIEIGRLLPADYVEERSRVLSGSEIRELSEFFQRMDAEYAAAPDRRKAKRPVDQKTRIAVWICLSTLCRIGELLSAEWAHIDLEKGIWDIPASNRKKVRVGSGKKARMMAQDLKVHLSLFARRQFAALHTITGGSRWCFPENKRPPDGEGSHLCLKTVSKQIGDRQIRFKNRAKRLKHRAADNSLVLANGTRGAWTPHDLRRTGSTLMQALDVPSEHINCCQGHAIAGVDPLDKVYLLWKYWPQKQEAWDKLGAVIEKILAGEKTPADDPQFSETSLQKK
jgi:integrase